jgi:Tfp pilus assembly PilM family ATPase
MARLLALEWGLREARVAVARTQGGGVVVEHAFAVDLGPRDAGQTFSDETVGAKVAQALAARGIGRAETLVAVGRANIELRQLTLPPSPLEELPDLVRFQALRQFTTIGEDWPIDFVYLDTSEDETFSVLAAAISPDVVSQIAATCQAIVSSSPKRLVLRAFAAASLLRRHDHGTAQPCRLMVDLLADEADLTVLVDEAVVLMRTVRLAIAEDGTVQTKALLGEIRRTIASAQNQLRGRRVEKVILCGDGTDQSTLKEEIEGGLSLAVELFDPFDGIEVDAALKATRPNHPGRFAPLLGMLLDEAAGATHPIDFLHPRKRPEAPSQSKRYSLIGGAIAATLLLIAAGIYYKLSSMDAVIADLNDESVSLKKDVETANASIAQARVVEQFLANDITWLDELYSMAKQLPPPEDAIFNEIQMTTRQPSGAQIVLQGHTREAEQLSHLRESLRVQERSIVSTGTSDDVRRQDYNWRFKETVLLTKTISLDSSNAGSPPGEASAAASEPERAPSSTQVPTNNK